MYGEYIMWYDMKILGSVGLCIGTDIYIRMILSVVYEYIVSDIAPGMLLFHVIAGN